MGGIQPDAVADPDNIYGIGEERLFTGATIITLIRTVVSAGLAAWAAAEQNLTLLVIGLAVYWVGDMADGAWARWRDCETRIGAVIDIMCDRFNAGAFYFGLAWLQPDIQLWPFIESWLAPMTFLSALAFCLPFFPHKADAGLLFILAFLFTQG